MRRLSLLPFLLLSAVTSGLAQTAPVDITVALEQKGGWMPAGWGSFRLKVTNTSAAPIRLIRWSGRWRAKGALMGAPWGADLNETVQPGQTFQKVEVGYMPTDSYEAAKPAAPQIVANLTIAQGNAESQVPFTLDVPGATLPEPLKTIFGKTVGISLMESRYKNFKNPQRALRWIDESYQAMIDLTGEHPFDGAKMIFKESPAHPYWAYAGKEMILNTDYVEATLKEFDEGLISFGWVHEVGHNFDVLGDWYIWAGPSAEFQANFKLAYAVETIKDQSFRIPWAHQAPLYPASAKDLRVTGRDFVDHFFVPFGDRYLADSSRPWTSMSSDDIHSLFQRIQRVYGWDVFKGWYRTYRRLAASGKKAPSTPAEKVNLAVAILSHECHVDLTPLFATWRFPVTAESMTKAAVAYGVEGP